MTCEFCMSHTHDTDECVLLDSVRTNNEARLHRPVPGEYIIAAWLVVFISLGLFLARGAASVLCCAFLAFAFCHVVAEWFWQALHQTHR